MLLYCPSASSVFRYLVIYDVAWTVKSPNNYVINTELVLGHNSERSSAGETTRNQTNINNNCLCFLSNA